MTETGPAYQGGQPTPAEPLSPHMERLMRQWPRERITPKTVARGLDALLAEVDRLRAENARLEGWGENTMDDSYRILVRAQAAMVGVLEAVGSGRGASALLDEIDEAVRQLGAGRGEG